MNNNILKYISKRHKQKILDKIITKIFDIVLYPLRWAYEKYYKSDVRLKRQIKLGYKKMNNNIYRVLANNDCPIYITDFWISDEDECSNIISIDQENYYLKYYTKKTIKELFDEVEIMLMADKGIEVKQIEIEDLFKYCNDYYVNKGGRVLEVKIINKDELDSEIKKEDYISINDTWIGCNPPELLMKLPKDTVLIKKRNI